MRRSLLIVAVFALGIYPGVAKYDGHPPGPPPLPKTAHHAVHKPRPPVTIAVVLTRLKARYGARMSAVSDRLSSI